jgi:hypothetical protein
VGEKTGRNCQLRDGPSHVRRKKGSSDMTDSGAAGNVIKSAIARGCGLCQRDG